MESPGSRVDVRGRMRVLVVLSSANQMYSGIGRAAFEFARHLVDRVAYEFAVDDLHPRNRDLVVDFGREHGLPVHVGRGTRSDEGLDAGNLDLPDLIRRDEWDLIECLGFANSATNCALIDAIGPRVPVGYTPHDQPLWTVPMSPQQAARIAEVHDRTLRRAEVVFCDSPVERDTLAGRIPHRSPCVFVPLGCDFRTYKPGPLVRRYQLLFIGDLAEPRKRFDRTLAAFDAARLEIPDLRLRVIGNRSDSALDLIPDPLRPHVDILGYVPESEVRRELAEAAGLLLLSDFEAFGIPILEALACGTPAFLSRQDTTFSLFGGFQAAHFLEADDPGVVAAAVIRSIKSGETAIAGAIADRRRLAATFSWEILAERKWRALAAAWFQKSSWMRSA